MEFRHEYKYIISERQAAILKNRVSALMAPDSHAGESGTYEIRSVYFDDIDDALIEGLEQNQDFFSLLLSNDEMKRQVLGIFADEIYKSLRNAD